MSPSRHDDQLPAAEEGAYPSSLRHVEFSFRTPQKLGSIFKFDLVVDDGFLQEGDLPIDLRVLGSEVPLNREFAHLDLSGGALRSALPALLAQAAWDPDTEVRVSSIAALGKLVREGGGKADLSAEEVEAIHETLRQIFLSPLSAPPTSQGEEHAPVILRLYEKTPAGEIAIERIQVAVLRCLDQSVFGEARPATKQIFDVLRGAKDNRSRHQLMGLLEERILESPTREVRRALLEEQIHGLLTTQIADGADLLGSIRQHDPVFVDSKVASLLLDGNPAQSVKLLGIIAELYRRGTPFQEGLIEMTLAGSASSKVRFMACKSGLSEEGLLLGVYDPSWRVQDESIKQLRERSLSSKAIGVLGRYLEPHQPHFVRLAAIKVLSSIPDTTPATKTLLEALWDEDPRIADLSGVALARSRDLNRVLHYSQVVLSDPDSLLKGPVVAFLSHLEKDQCQLPTAFYPLLVKLISSRGESRNVREGCAEIIARHAEPEDSKRILGSLKPRVGTTMQRYIDKVLEYVETHPE